MCCVCMYTTSGANLPQGTFLCHWRSHCCCTYAGARFSGILLFYFFYNHRLNSILHRVVPFEEYNISYGIYILYMCVCVYNMRVFSLALSLFPAAEFCFFLILLLPHPIVTVTPEAELVFAFVKRTPRPRCFWESICKHTQTTTALCSNYV